jgi:hypothetical protein
MLEKSSDKLPDFISLFPRSVCTIKQVSPIWQHAEVSLADLDSMRSGPYLVGFCSQILESRRENPGDHLTTVDPYYIAKTKKMNANINP